MRGRFSNFSVFFNYDISYWKIKDYSFIYVTYVYRDLQFELYPPDVARVHDNILNKTKIYMILNI